MSISTPEVPEASPAYKERTRAEALADRIAEARAKSLGEIVLIGDGESVGEASFALTETVTIGEAEAHGRRMFAQHQDLFPPVSTEYDADHERFDLQQQVKKAKKAKEARGEA